MKTLRAINVLFMNQLVRLVRSRRALIAVLLGALPVAMAFAVTLVSHKQNDSPPVMEIGWILIVQVIVPTLALVVGSAVVSEEVEDRTITFIFTRPIPRPVLLLGRWLGSTVFLLAVLTASAVGTIAVFRLGLSDFPQAALPSGVTVPLVQVVLIGGVVYSAAFAALGTRFKHPMIIGLAYVFAIEVLLSNFPGKTQILTIQYYLRSFVKAYGSDDWERIAVFRNSLFDTGPEALWTLGFILAVALASGSWILSRRQYVLPS